MEALNRRHFLAATLAALGTSCATTPPRRARCPESRPNVVFILADDMGTGDVQALWPEGKIKTPHLDRLVSESLSFSDAHSGSAVCTPTRYGLLTGRYAWRTRLQRWVLDVCEPPLIAPDRLTLPGMLQQEGYRTACIGKWHLGFEYTGTGFGREMKVDISQPLRSGPTTRGFDYYFGTDVPNFPPYTFVENDHYAIPPTEHYKLRKDIHVGFEGAPIAPGWEFENILPTITQRAVDYVHEQAASEQPFFLFFSMTSPHEPLTPSAMFQGKSGINTIADFIMETDWSAGQVIQALDDAGVAENTLLVFATDNGHSHYTGWEELLKAGHQPSGPYRGHKGDIYEGGHRVPFVVRWPGVVAPGTKSDQTICHVDFMATLAELLGVELPDNTAEDSVSLLPAFRGETKSPLRSHLVNHDVRGNFALRQGPWKLVILAGENRLPPKYELYNLDEDIAEARDLAPSQPERVRQMEQYLQGLIDRGRSTPGAPQPNDTLDIDLHRYPVERYGRPRSI